EYFDRISWIFEAFLNFCFCSAPIGIINISMYTTGGVEVKLLEYDSGNSFSIDKKFNRINTILKTSRTMSINAVNALSESSVYFHRCVWRQCIHAISDHLFLHRASWRMLVKQIIV